MSCHSPYLGDESNPSTGGTFVDLFINQRKHQPKIKTLTISGGALQRGHRSGRDAFDRGLERGDTWWRGALLG